MAIFEVASERKIVKKRGILAAHMYMEYIGSTLYNYNSSYEHSGKYDLLFIELLI